LNKETIILGVDPGTSVMGYGIICVKNNKISLITMGVIHLNKLDDHFLRLKKIFEKITALIEEYHPDEMSVEAPFFGKNVQSMLKLGRAQGVALAAAVHRGIPVNEYSPKKIKQSITGNGNASKEQVAAMIKTLLNTEITPKFLDATDGTAAAICHHFQKGTISSSKNYTGWKAFIQENPKRAK
jgi:crossover junction endodeoxyribonuclease RuvC